MQDNWYNWYPLQCIALLLLALHVLSALLPAAFWECSAGRFAESSSPTRMSTMAEARGVYSPGTTKRSTVSLYDTQGSHFEANPVGPFEEPQVCDQDTAQNHFTSTREIKLKDTYGQPLPPSTYREHYPPKELPEIDRGLALDPGHFPFTSRTEHNDQYFNKPNMARPHGPLVHTHRPAPWMGKETTNQATYKPFNFADKEKPTRGRPAEQPPRNPFDFSTTYGTQYVPKDAPGREPTGLPERRAPMPWLADGTTYRDHYVPKELALVPVFDPEGPGVYPFDGTTEYRAEYIPKEKMPQVPPLTGIISRDGLSLPLPRRSLGVEFWHKGKPDNFFVLIPRHTDVPCSACQVFTTLHDNQEVACILVLYGDDPVASNNMLLGQFDIVNIPPAPKDVPRIEVRYHLSKDMVLTAEARDLDTERHKIWQQRGEVLVVKK